MDICVDFMFVYWFTSDLVCHSARYYTYHPQCIQYIIAASICQLILEVTIIEEVQRNPSIKATIGKWNCGPCRGVALLSKGVDIWAHLGHCESIFTREGGLYDSESDNCSNQRLLFVELVHRLSLEWLSAGGVQFSHTGVVGKGRLHFSTLYGQVRSHAWPRTLWGEALIIISGFHFSLATIFHPDSSTNQC